MGQFAMADYEAKVLRAIQHRKKYAAGRTVAGRTDTEFETYLLGELQVIKDYIKAQADVAILGTKTDTATDNIETALVANNDSFRGEFGRNSEAVKDLEPVSHPKPKGGGRKKKAPST